MHFGPHSQLRRIYWPKGQSALAHRSHSDWYPPLAPRFAVFRTPVLGPDMNSFSHFRHTIAAWEESPLPLFLLTPLPSKPGLLPLLPTLALVSSQRPVVGPFEADPKYRL
jgi:hypothetical protein